MYRKHMRMSRDHDADSNTVGKSRFIQHLANLPAVFIAWNLAAGTYKSLKSSSRLLNKSLNTVERTAKFVSKQAEPLLKKFEPQIKAVDDLACRGIKNLEVIIPIITKQPGKVMQYTRRKYNEMVESGLHKYEDVKQTALITAKEVSDVGLKRSSEFLASPSGQLIVMALNSTFDAYEMYLDHILPPLGDERPERAFGDRARPPVLERADALTERLKERFYKHLLLQLQNMRIRGKLTLSRLYHTSIVNYELIHA